jgi:hypothetical protein
MRKFSSGNPNHGVDASSSGMIAAGEYSSRFSNILTPDIYFASASAASTWPEYNAKISGRAGTNGDTGDAGDTSGGMVTSGSGGTGGGAGTRTAYCWQ